MNRNLGVRVAVAAALFGAVPLAAFANTVAVTPPADLTGNPPANAATGSGLFLEAYDPILNKGFVEYLGPSWQSFGPGAVTPGTTYDFGTMGGTGSNSWSSVFAASVAAGNPIDFMVLSSNISTTGAFSFQTTGPSTGLGTLKNGGVSGAANNIASAFAALPTASNPIVGLTAGDAGNAFFAAIGTTIAGQFTSVTLNGVAGGTAVNFFQATQSSSSPLGNANVVKYTGGGSDALFSLTAAGDLQFNVPGGAVPLPAAVWLFGSGLLGLIGVGRRRAQSA